MKKFCEGCGKVINPQTLICDACGTDYNEKPQCDCLYDQMALLEFIDEHRDHPSICDVVRRRQVELWDNPVYKILIGGEDHV